MPIIKRKCKISYAYMKEIMDRLGFVTATIDGGYFLWAKLPAEQRDAFKFALDLYNSVKIGVVPGENFSKTKTGYIRVNIATELPVIRNAASRLKEFFSKGYGTP